MIGHGMVPIFFFGSSKTTWVPTNRNLTTTNMEQGSNKAMKASARIVHDFWRKLFLCHFCQSRILLSCLVHIFTFPMNFYIDWKNAFRFCQFFTVYFSLRAVAPALKDTFVILYCKEQVMLNIICFGVFSKEN